MGEGFGDLAPRTQPLTPGFAVPSPLGEGRYRVPAINLNVEIRRAGQALPLQHSTKRRATDNGPGATDTGVP